MMFSGRAGHVYSQQDRNLLRGTVTNGCRPPSAQYYTDVSCSGFGRFACRCTRTANAVRGRAGWYNRRFPLAKEYHGIKTANNTSTGPTGLTPSYGPISMMSL